jgi:DNA-directed RNA polymerase subunit F
MTDKSALQIKKFLTEKIALEEAFAINIINIDPKTVPELRVILEKSAVGKTLNDEQLQELLYQVDELKSS